MKKNKNIIKGNKQAELKGVTKHMFYAVIQIGEKSYVEEFEGTRIEAKRELQDVANKMGGKITHFGGFRN